MPQLWIETWVSQYFWLLVILVLFHIYMVNKVIPAIATIIKIRKTLGKEEIGIEKAGSTLAGLKVNLPTPSSQAASPTEFNGKTLLKKWLSKN